MRVIDSKGSSIQNEDLENREIKSPVSTMLLNKAEEILW